MALPGTKGNVGLVLVEWRRRIDRPAHAEGKSTALSSDPSSRLADMKAQNVIPVRALALAVAGGLEPRTTGFTIVP